MTPILGSGRESVKIGPEQLLRNMGQQWRMILLHNSMIIECTFVCMKPSMNAALNIKSSMGKKPTCDCLHTEGLFKRAENPFPYNTASLNSNIYPDCAVKSVRVQV
ncbi:MAG: hypothetical protein CL912_04640 [Deltaproteobacteria bacterium]|nr:hypothetical protein [Deltaproteobacteria bacterium]